MISLLTGKNKNAYFKLKCFSLVSTNEILCKRIVFLETHFKTRHILSNYKHLKDNYISIWNVVRLCYSHLT